MSLTLLKPCCSFISIDRQTVVTMSVIRTKHISDTGKFIHHYAGGGGGGNTSIPSVSLHNQPGTIGSISTSAGIKPVPIKKHTTTLELISDGVPPTGPITVPQKTVMRKRQVKGKTQHKKRGTSSTRKKSRKPSVRKPSSSKASSKRSQPPSKKAKKRALPPDVI